MSQDLPLPGEAFFERYAVRLSIVLYYCGESHTSLFEGETRQVDSLAHLQTFDFWVREPGHLALALLHAYTATPEWFVPHETLLRETFDRMLTNRRLDTQRIPLTGTPYHILADLDDGLIFLTSRALVSDRPSFGRSRSHQIILESAGIEFVKQVFEKCPSFGWYRTQCEAVATFWPTLERFDLRQMPYLAPDLTPMLANNGPLMPVVLQRYEKLFGERVIRANV